jgi:ubiquinone/menaquinone biosynthesis C-methylase UbiE
LSGAAHWEAEAERFAAWAREPGHDAYWTESGPPFFDLLPAPGRRTLDLGCGEGRLARDLKARGHNVTGVDAAPTMIRLAREADPEENYLVADAAALPFEDESFDLVVAFNSLMDVDDMPGAVSEAGRVLEANGRLCACITHPMRDAGRFESREPDARFIIAGSYLEKRLVEMKVARAGLEVHFRSWAYPLEDYMRAIENAGFLVESLREPPDPDRDIPNFLLIRAIKCR